MAYETGTATDYLDLLDKLRVFLTSNASLVAAGQQWQVLRWQTDNNGEKELILKAPGLAGTDNIYCGILTKSDANVPYYVWQLNGFTSFDSAADFFQQQGAVSFYVNRQLYTPGGFLFMSFFGPTSPKMLLWNRPMRYWVVANGRRAIIVVKVGSLYEAAYLGFFLPYAMPSQYPYPMVVGGSCLNHVIPTTEVDHSHFTYPTSGLGVVSDFTTCNVRTPDNTNWLGLKTIDVVAPNAFVWPSKASVKSLRESPEGSHALLPVVLASKDASQNTHNILGELDGVYYVDNFNLAAEDVINVNGNDYLIVQNVFRNHELWALKLA